MFFDGDHIGHIHITGSPVPPISPVSPVNLLYFGNPNFASYIFQKTPVSPVFSKYSPRTSYKKMKKFPAFYKYHKSLWLMTCISHDLILIKCHFFIYYYVLMSSKLRYWLIFGWSYMHPECRKMYHFASRFQKNSGGDTPEPPFRQGASALFFRPSALKGLPNWLNPLSRVARSSIVVLLPSLQNHPHNEYVVIHQLVLFCIIIFYDVMFVFMCVFVFCCKTLRLWSNFWTEMMILSFFVTYNWREPPIFWSTFRQNLLYFFLQISCISYIFFEFVTGLPGTVHIPHYQRSKG